MTIIVYIMAAILITVIITIAVNFLIDKVSTASIEFENNKIPIDENIERTLDMIVSKLDYYQQHPRVYISYSFKDTSFVDQLSSDLNKYEIDVWRFNEQVKVGANISDAIRTGIDSCQWFVVVISENSRQSNNVNLELEQALIKEKRLERPFVLPLVISGSDVQNQLEGRVYADFRKDYKSGLYILLSRLKSNGDRVDTLKPKRESQFQPFVLVLMPFDDESRLVYDEIIKPAISSLGINVRRIDDLFSVGNIAEEILRAIKDSELIIADTTKRNPNVFYEVGIAHALGKSVIFLTQDSNDLPFDFRHGKYIKYDLMRGKELESALEVAIRDITE